MNKLLLLTLSILLFTSTYAQHSNLIFFSEQGERFSIVLNGVLQNAQPQTNIKVTDLPAPNYKVKVIFEGTGLPDIDRTLVFGQGKETTYSIRQNKKHQYIIRYNGEIPIPQVMREVPTQEVIVYHPAPLVQSTTTTSTTVTTQTGSGMGVHVNDPSTGANVNIDLNMGGTSSQVTTTSTTTTTTVGTGNNDRDHARPDYSDRNDEPREDHSQNDRHDHHSGDHNHGYRLEGYNGEYGCPYPMSPADFEQAKQSIRSKSFEDSKLTIAKQIINTNCLLSSQVKEIMLLFSFEDTRLELAKYCYGYTLDIGNYYKVNDAFTFESSIDELNAYIGSFKR